MLLVWMIPQFDSIFLSALLYVFTVQANECYHLDSKRTIERTGGWRMGGDRHFTASSITSACFLGRHVSLFDGSGRTEIQQWL